ncbi:copper amine oxidase [Paenibacillus spiritus]|uniref:Copper amine oxidase n=1 Tax=Paenibacillus spiritus TaxID=2496557 RepID=A0A5J5FU03_9BACL|nr:GDSL-type esterase/lipase family protein [Paenibacillus spiritus]KAA8997144.1 copper amine oxidase [Paenibacillus spiritus]
MNKFWRITGAALAGGLLLASQWLAGSAQAAAGGAAPREFHLVALGDSITAGYEPGITEAGQAYGYAERLLEQAWYRGERATLVNEGILGLTSAGLKHYTAAVQTGTAVKPEEIQTGLADPRIAAFASGVPQARADLAAADLIVITIGGNDVMDLFKNVQKLPDPEFQTGFAQRLAGYKENLTASLANIRSVNPSAVILLADQYQPVPSIAGSVYQKLNAAADQFTAAAKEIAAAASTDGGKVVLIPVSERFRGAEGSLTHFLKNGDIHPTQDGYEQIAQAFAEAIWSQYRVPAALTVPLPAGQQPPMTIVVNSTELNTPNKPILKSGQNFLALADVLKAMGVQGKWDNRTSSATIVNGSRTIVITIGSKTMKVNGQPVALATPAFLQRVGKTDKTYLPLAALASGLGFDVQYSAHLRTAFINP